MNYPSNASSKISELLQLPKGIISFIGGGGKTSLMLTLAKELSQNGCRVILTTSTHIYPYEGMPLLDGAQTGPIHTALKEHLIVCVGNKELSTGKLTSPALSFQELSHLADYVFVEADGSKHLPLKAHRPNEPVIPDGSAQKVLVIGAQAVGKTIKDAAHCPELYASLAGCQTKDPVSASIVSKVIQLEKLHSVIYVNAVESEPQLAFALELSHMLTCKVIWGSLQKGVYSC